jgi:hypothetical protein
VAYPIHNGTVSDSQPMLIRFVTDAYPFCNGFFFFNKILKFIEERDLYSCDIKENVKRLTVLK